MLVSLKVVIILFSVFTVNFSFYTHIVMFAMSIVSKIKLKDCSGKARYAPSSHKTSLASVGHGLVTKLCYMIWTAFDLQQKFLQQNLLHQNLVQSCSSLAPHDQD